MQRPKGKNDDPFLKIAIPFILGVVMGFTLVLMGFILIVVAILGFVSGASETSPWIWLLLAVASEGIGSYMMYKTLIGTPTPGTFGDKK